MDAAFLAGERALLACLELGTHEVWRALHQEADTLGAFLAWVRSRRGGGTLEEGLQRFGGWLRDGGFPAADLAPGGRLGPEERAAWHRDGYLRVPAAVPGALCDALVEEVSRHLALDPGDPETWYRPHPDWQGLMVQRCHGPALEALRHHPALRAVFADLHGTDRLLPACEKVSVNPPETARWRFRGSPLHWDVDPDHPVDLARDPSHVRPYAIQGLVYLVDVPPDLGPLVLVPGFHHGFTAYVAAAGGLGPAHEAVRRDTDPIAVPGGKGDLVAWHQALPHAASPNRGERPRFAAYVSFCM
ncbi:MAG: phytanoyl-CoA dioxygenase family protein [Holophagaceae bacterium]